MDALWPAVIAMLTNQATTLDIALALGALLALSARDPLWIFECALIERRQSRWLLWCLLVALGIASSTFGILQPEQFAAAFGVIAPPPMMFAAP